MSSGYQQENYIFRAPKPYGQEGVREYSWGPLVEMVAFHPMDGVLREFVGVSKVHFYFDVSPVGFHRFGADMEFLRDVSGPPPLADQLERLQFSVAERTLGNRFRVRGAVCNFMEHFGRHLLA